jgi:hypothetical protein
MTNFLEREFNQQLLLDMYNTPSKELSVEQIAEIISEKKGVKVDSIMVSAIYKTLGASLNMDLDLRRRLRVAPKLESNKPARVTKADILNDIFDDLGLIEGQDPITENEEYEEEHHEEEVDYSWQNN